MNEPFTGRRLVPLEEMVGSAHPTFFNFAKPLFRIKADR